MQALEVKAGLGGVGLRFAALSVAADSEVLVTGYQQALEACRDWEDGIETDGVVWLIQSPTDASPLVIRAKHINVCTVVHL